MKKMKAKPQEVKLLEFVCSAKEGKYSSGTTLKYMRMDNYSALRKDKTLHYTLS